MKKWLAGMMAAALVIGAVSVTAEASGDSARSSLKSSWWWQIWPYAIDLESVHENDWHWFETESTASQQMYWFSIDDWSTFDQVPWDTTGFYYLEFPFIFNDGDWYAYGLIGEEGSETSAQVYHSFLRDGWALVGDPSPFPTYVPEEEDDNTNVPDDEDSQYGDAV
jgi:hypothetical protein